jgi:hypothetical protein
MFQQRHIEIIINYFKEFGRDETRLKALLKDIVNISQNMCDTDSIVRLEIALVVAARKNKSNQ